MKTDNPKRGGKRENAGRKPMFGETLNRYQVMLTQKQKEKALQLGDGNLSAGIRKALDAFLRVYSAI